MTRSSFLLLLCLLYTMSRSQTYNFAHYTEENGLNQSYIYCITQSKGGFLTLSTGEAITWFDGKHFSSFVYKHFAENMITAHYEDSRGVTWLIHQQSGLSYLKNGQYYRFTDKQLSELKIFQVLEDAQHVLWLATSGGLFKMDADFKVTSFPLRGHTQVNAICFDTNYNIVLGTPQGALVIKPSDQLVTELSFTKDKNISQVVAADPFALNLWLLVDNEAAYCISTLKENYTLKAQVQEQLEAAGNPVTTLYSDHAGNLWLSVFGDGLRKLDFERRGVYTKFMVEKINKLNGLKSDHIQSILQDSEGNMWLGTFGEGLIKKPLEMFSFFGPQEGIVITDVTKVLKADNDDLWMGTNKGLTVLKAQDHSYHIFNSSNGFVTDKINALYMDNAGLLWIGTNENGIYRYDPAKGRFENFSKKYHLAHPSINVIAGIDNKIMVGTGDGLYVFNKDATLEEELTTNDGLFHNNILNLFKDSQNRLWVCSYGTPPYYIKDQKITPFRKIQGLNSFNINAVCEDQRGNIWIATEGDGVFKYDNKTFQQYTSQEGLLSDYCEGIETGNSGVIWVTHRNGVSALRPFHERFIGFTSKKGLLFCENNLNAIYKDREDKLWFGTAQGVAMYDMRSGLMDVQPPEIFISKIELNNATYYPGEPIEKDYAYYSVHIDYKAISLSDPEAIYYRYRLLDVDSSFKTTTMTYVDLPKLGDGKYHFEVIACNESTGLCSRVPARISFSIGKPMWKQAWFYVLLLAVVMMLTYFVVLLRTRSLRRTQQILEIRIDQKTYLLKREKEAVEEIKIQLEHKNKDITDSIHYAKNIQDSLLPSPSAMKQLFRENYFVLFKPKDIVSGDFYWCAARRVDADTQLALAAVIDCTGHGVPGAFLSILANDFLKQSLSEKEIRTPDQILNYLNNCVSSHFIQQEGKDRIRDGMDIALVGIDYVNLKLYFAGANNPVYVFRPVGNGCVEEIIIKATKQAIGSVHEVTQSYELEEIDLLKGDMIYLFSDGYADQFGGPRNKKVTYKAFRTILAEACTLPLWQQKEHIESRLEAWKGEAEQTDDVCVFGIRI